MKVDAQLPASYLAFLLTGGPAKYAGKRPAALAHWAASMCTPLEFEPEVLRELFVDGSTAVPLARFLTESGEQLSNRDDHLVIERDGSVLLREYDGALTPIAPDLQTFLASLK